jgi:hypothetical protein
MIFMLYVLVSSLLPSLSCVIRRLQRTDVDIGFKGAFLDKGWAKKDPSPYNQEAE